MVVNLCFIQNKTELIVFQNLDTMYSVKMHFLTEVFLLVRVVDKIELEHLISIIICFQILLWLLWGSTGCDSVSASYASGPEIDLRARHTLSWIIFIPPLLIQEEQVVSYWHKNGH